MKTTLAIRPEFPEFDLYRALSWIKNEADWVSLRFVQEHTHQRTVRNQHPENNSELVNFSLFAVTNHALA